MFETIGRVSKDNDGKIIKNENEEKIKVNIYEYLKLLKFCGGWNRFILLQLIMFGFTICKIQSDYSIGLWANLESYEEQQEQYGWFTFLTFSYATGTSAFVFLRTAVIAAMTLKAA